MWQFSFILTLLVPACTDKKPDPVDSPADSLTGDAAETVCDGADDDGDGVADDGFPDADGDGAMACVDCDEADPLIRPGVAELDDGIDNDCDGTVDNFARISFEKILDITVGSDMVALPDGRLILSDMGTASLILVDPAVPEIQAQIAYPNGYPAMLSLLLDPAFGDGAHDYLYVYAGNLGVSRYPLTLSPFGIGAREPVFDPGCTTDDMACHGDMAWWSGETERPALYILTTHGPQMEPQDSRNLGSKLLAIHVDPATGEGTPAAPPGADGYVAAVGMRNPWRVVDCGAALCIVDPGDESWEELNLYRGAGMNFGWDQVEGMSGGIYDDPAVTWQDDDPAWAAADATGPGVPGFANVPSVGMRVPPSIFGGKLAGMVLFSEFFDGWVRGLPLGDDGAVLGASVPLGHQPFLMSMVEAGGEIYALDIIGGLYRVGLWEDRPQPQEALLSETHHAEAVPFDVRYALWSNGADKQRSIWLPPGTAIDTQGDAWVFPEGTEIFKTFSVAGSPVETRMLVLRDGRWLGTVFLWAGADAARYDGDRQTLTAADGSPYTVPGETSCADCHDATRGRAWPLFSPFLLGDEGLAQLAPLLDAPPDPAPDVEGDALTQAARGYLQANCAFCHNAGGMTGRIGTLDLDLSYDVPVTFVDQETRYWHDGQREVIADPANPARSALVRVMESAEMPFVGVWTPDAEGIALVQEWIGTL